MRPLSCRCRVTGFHAPTPAANPLTPPPGLCQVLSEIEDIVDLPYRADRCWEMLEADDANLVPAFEALVLLIGTAENAKQAWQRWVYVYACMLSYVLCFMYARCVCMRATL